MASGDPWRAILVLALAASLAACASNPPPRNTHSGTIASVYSCAVSVVEGERYELETERRESDAWFAVFAKPGVRAYVVVARSEVGRVFVEVHANSFGRTWVREEGLTSMIEQRCMQTR